MFNVVFNPHSFSFYLKVKLPTGVPCYQSKLPSISQIPIRENHGPSVMNRLMQNSIVSYHTISNSPSVMLYIGAIAYAILMKLSYELGRIGLIPKMRPNYYS
jgi:hypothetical protein